MAPAPALFGPYIAIVLEALLAPAWLLLNTNAKSMKEGWQSYILPLNLLIVNTFNTNIQQKQLQQQKLDPGF